MKKYVIATAVAAAVFAPQAFAQAKNFEGFSLAANLAVAKSKVDFTTSGTTLTYDGSTTSLDLQAQYAFAIGPQFLLGVGVTLGTGTNNAGSLSGIEFSTKNRTAIDFIPTFAASNDLAIFGKISALNATAAATSGGSETSEGISGIGYGFGIRSLLDKNLYFQASYDINTYSEKNLSSTITYKPSSTVLSLGVGYKF